MVFSSAPLFLDPPNWHHQQPASNDETSQRAAQDMPAAAGFPAAEGQLKCPRCDSSNTKFCYFNNYSLTQPRHFCKTCRRYWTRGGSLRNVPVGGGCRRNKRKRTSSTRRPRSPPAELQPPRAPPAEFMAPPQAPFSFMTSLQGLMTSSQLGVGSNLFGGFGPSSSSMLYPFQNNNNNNMDGNGMMETASFGKGLLGFPHQQQLPVKMEESGGSRANLLSKQFLGDVDVGMSQQQQQMTWSSAAAGSSGGLWTDLSRI